jgi:ligand-binding SRPBCC domain-containing protein
MTCIELNIEIAAERQVCFDLSRSIDLHQHTTKETNEKAINGRLKGLINEGEWVKWRATHFGISQTMTVEIKEMNKYDSFRDEMSEGPFKWMKHLHTFKTSNEKTVMTDVFEYEVPYGLFGKIFDRYILKPHMTKLLEQRNRIIKEVAESGQWKNFINHA